MALAVNSTNTLVVAVVLPFAKNTAGNLLTKQLCPIAAQGEEPTTVGSTRTYTYSGDRLVSFNGTALTYDALGNPLSYYNGKSAYTFTWNVRQMASATLNGNTYSFGYNADGLRTTKTVNGVTTEYIYNGSLLVAEITAGATVLYTYNANGVPIGMKYHGADYAAGAWDVYFYEHNIQGDIVAIYNLLGTKLVSYTYDAWGNFTVAYHNGGENTSVTKNPYTYRSYYFDTDLGLYYLQSRYYDQNIGRFVNADGYISTGLGMVDCNMYAYCDNNPANKVDYTGTFDLWIIWEPIFNCVMDLGNNIAESAINSFEAMFSFGQGVDVELDNIGVEVGVSNDAYIAVDDGEVTTGSIQEAELSIFGVGNSASKGSTSPSIETEFSFLFGKIKSNGDVVLGVSFGAHAILGGSVSLGVNISEFIRGLLEW